MIVAILRSEDGKVLSTEVIVTDDGLILTCCHVIENIKNKTLGKNSDIYFPEAKITKPAQIIEKYCDRFLDIAFLQLQEKNCLNKPL